MIRTSNSLIERCLGHLAGLVGRVEDLVVEHGEVESKAETDWMRGCEIGGGDFGSGLVRFKRLVCGLLALVGHGKLGEVAVIIALPIVQALSVIRSNNL